MTHSQRKCVLNLLVVDHGARYRPHLKGSTALAVRLAKTGYKFFGGAST